MVSSIIVNSGSFGFGLQNKTSDDVKCNGHVSFVFFQLFDQNLNSLLSFISFSLILFS